MSDIEPEERLESLIRRLGHERDVYIRILVQEVGVVAACLVAELVNLWSDAKFIGRWLAWDQPVESYKRDLDIGSFNIHRDHPRIRFHLSDKDDSPFLDLVVAPTVSAGWRFESMDVQPTFLGRVAIPQGKVGGEFVIGIEQGQDPGVIRQVRRAFFLMSTPTILLSEGEVLGGGYEGRVHFWDIDDFVISTAYDIARTRFGLQPW